MARGEDPFGRISGDLIDADVCLGNLEGPISTRSTQRPGAESTVFRGAPAAASRLRAAGIDVLNIANNHILQHGREAFSDTVEHLRRNGIDPIGLVGERMTSRPVVRTWAGVTIGFLGYSFVPERYYRGPLPYVNAGISEVVRDLGKLRNEVDCIVVSVHWGVEGRDRPNAEMIESARRMVGAGATVIVGHHPHYFQPIERRGRSLIAYSLGDFLFDLFWDDRAVESAILRISLEREGVADFDLLPVRLDRDYRIRPLAPRRTDRFKSGVTNWRSAVVEGASQGERPAIAKVREYARKLRFFVENIYRGDVKAKIRFLTEKLLVMAGLARY